MKPVGVLWLILTLMAVPAFAATRTTVSGHLITASGDGLAQGAAVRFTLLKCAGTPKVAGVGTLGFPRPDSSFQVAPGTDGAFSLQLWGNDTITCGKTVGKSKWLVQFFVNNAPVAESVYTIFGATFDLDTAAPE